MKWLLAAVALGAALITTQALADNYPIRPVRVFTTSSAGGISDIFMRALNEKMQPYLGQPLIIENKPGGAGNIAARFCQEAPPDGYTICIINADTMIYNQFLYKQVPFDPEKGLIPIVNLFHLIQVLVVNSSLNVKTVDELVAASKSKPGTLNYLTASIPCVVYMDTLTLVNNIRTPQLPDVPTLADLGYRGAPSQTWYGLFAPSGTPKPIIDRLNAEVRRAFEDKDFVDKFVITRGQVPAINSPDEFAKEIVTDRVDANEVVKVSGMEPQ